MCAYLWMDPVCVPALGLVRDQPPFQVYMQGTWCAHELGQGIHSGLYKYNVSCHQVNMPVSGIRYYRSGVTAGQLGHDGSSQETYTQTRVI